MCDGIQPDSMLHISQEQRFPFWVSNNWHCPDIFLPVQINELGVDPVDFLNAYLHGFTKEKMYTVAGPESCEWEGHIFIYLRSIYSLNTSMDRLYEALSDDLKLIELCPSKADPDFWIW